MKQTSYRWVMSAMVGVVVALTATPRADAGVYVVRGVELQLPDGWGQRVKGPVTLLAPTKHKGRAIEVISLATMPTATPEALKTLLGTAKLEITGAKEITRDGTKLVAASGKIVTPKGEVAIDMLAVPVKDKAVLLLSFVGVDQDPLIKKANIDIMLSARIPGPRMTTTYAAPTKAGLVGPPPAVVERISKLVTKLDGMLRMPRPLPVKFEQCGMINAFYKPAAHTITMCHELYDDFIVLFTGAGFERTKAEKMAEGAFMFTFFHELGHALVGELELPITGRGEDAADEIATLVLAQSPTVGHAAALSGAAWFEISSKKTGRQNVFWDTHSFDAQRLVTVLCLLYGADKAKYTPLMKSQKIPDSRLAKCSRDYPLRVKAWKGMMEPYKRRVK